MIYNRRAGAILPCIKPLEHMIIKDEYPEFHAAALRRGCIEGTAEYYGFIEGCIYKQQHIDKLCEAIEQVLENAKEFEKINETIKHILG